MREELRQAHVVWSLDNTEEEAGKEQPREVASKGSTNRDDP